MSRIGIDKVTDEVLARERGAWRAVVRLPADMAAAPGVMGGATAEGPWVEGFGAGPSEALRDAVHAAGLALLSKMEGEERRAAEVELHKMPARIGDALSTLVSVFKKRSKEERVGGSKDAAHAWSDAADEVEKVPVDGTDDLAVIRSELGIIGDESTVDGVRRFIGMYRKAVSENDELRQRSTRVVDALSALEGTFREWSEKERQAKKDADRVGEWGKADRYKAGEDAWRDAANEVKKAVAGLSGSES